MKELMKFKISLVGSDPLIWRRFHVPSDMSFSMLHDIIQVVMGWKDYHLYEFNLGEFSLGIPSSPQDKTNPDQLFGNADYAELSQMLIEPCQLLYIYDYGDNWQHTLELEELADPEPTIKYPICIGGERNCPPEDCGGIQSYQEDLEILGNKNHPRHRIIRGHYPRFDPASFSLVYVNRKLSKFRKFFDLGR